MKKQCFRGGLAALGVLLFACTTPTETTEVPETEAAIVDTEAVTEPLETEATEAETEVQSTGSQLHTVDVSAITTPITVGKGDGRIIATTWIAETQEAVFFAVQNDTYEEIGRVTLTESIDQINAVAESAGNIAFTGYTEATEHTGAMVQFFRVNLETMEAITLYQSTGDALNRGQNLFFSGDDLVITENITEQDGLYFVELSLLASDAKHVINVEVFPSDTISVHVKDGRAVYAASRDDHLVIIDADLATDESKDVHVEGDSAAFRLTDWSDDGYLLDNFTGHGEQRNALALWVKDEGLAGAFAMEEDNVHSAAFWNGQKVALASLDGQERLVYLEDEYVVRITEEGFSHGADVPFTQMIKTEDGILRFPSGNRGVLETLDYYEQKAE